MLVLLCLSSYHVLKAAKMGNEKWEPNGIKVLWEGHRRGSEQRRQMQSTRK